MSRKKLHNNPENAFGPEDTYSTLELDPSVNLPELSDRRSSNEPPINTYTRHHYPYGLRKRTFWIISIITTLSVIAIAFGTGIGVSSNNSSNRDAKREVSPDSRLAAANYTDSNGNKFTHVYFQDTAGEIRMIKKNISNNTWPPSVGLRNINGTRIIPKVGTPIAAGNYLNPNITNSTDFHLRFIDKNHVVRMLYANDMGVDGWKIHEADGTFAASERSRLVAHLYQCSWSASMEVLIFSAFQAGDVFKALLRRSTSFDVGKLIVDVEAAVGSPFATVPIPAKDPSENQTQFSGPNVAIFYRSNAGMLEETYVNTTLNWMTKHVLIQKSLEDKSALAAMTQIMDGKITIQVLNTVSSGGVELTYYDGRLAMWKPFGSISSMESVRPFSPIAATQAGRVYAFVDDKDGPALTEWVRKEGSLTEFEKVGVADTKIS